MKQTGMSNDVKNCWFYQLCKKQCTKDVGMIFGGAVLVLVMLILFRWIISTYQFILILVGGFLVVSGFKAFFTKLPRVKAFLKAMPPEWFSTLGNYAPQCRFGTFYPTEYYLCIPSEYIMIRYCDIIGIKVKEITTGGVLTGITLELSLAATPEQMNVIVYEWREFPAQGGEFLSFLEERKNAMSAENVQGNVVQ